MSATTIRTRLSAVDRAIAELPHRTRIVLTVIAAVGMAATLAPYLIAHFSPLETQQGPQTDLLSTSGVFRPGGYVKFTINTNIHSLDGHFDAKVLVNAEPTEAQQDDGINFKARESSDRSPWGDKIADAPLKSIRTLKAGWLIPNDPALSGSTIKLSVTVDVTYPLPTSDRKYFYDQGQHFHEWVEIPVGEQPLSSRWDTFRAALAFDSSQPLDKPGYGFGWTGLLCGSVLCWVSLFFGIILMWVTWLSLRHSRKENALAGRADAENNPDLNN
jgi:hypothetical protein